jgi:ABC-type transporter Mla MlaB component
MAASAPQTVVFAIDGPIARTDLPRLCEEIGALLERTGAEVALCDVSSVGPDAVSVDVLARVQLAARRRGCQARLRGASNELLELLAFIGLCDVLPERR